MDSLMWSYFAYALVGILFLFVVFVGFMMARASKDERKGSNALPLLSENDAAKNEDDDGDFFFEDGFKEEAEPKKKTGGPSDAKKGTRSFFKKESGDTKTHSGSSNSSSIFEDEDFDITEGADVDSPR